MRPFSYVGCTSCRSCNVTRLSLIGKRKVTAAEDATTTTADEAGADSGQLVEQGCGESFTAGTKVLLASGAAIPISQLTPGEKVLATNTNTGRTSPEAVAAVMVKKDTDKYDLTIRSGHRTAVIDTTRNHLFWDVSHDRWVKAGALKHGDHLRTSSGSMATVVGGHTPASTVGWMWDISVPGGGDHDFYVAVASIAVLVHNCPVGPSSGKPDFNDSSNPPGPGWEWRGPADKGAWYNPETGETLHPDLEHPDPIGPHYDYRAPNGQFYRIFPDGRIEPR